MNKKGKNKKGKVPNPCQEVTLSDKLDSEVISDEGNSGQLSDVIKSVEETTDSVKKERVPEIINVISPPSIVKRDEETPKKPKRNKNNKKKGKDDDLDNILAEEPKENVTESETKDNVQGIEVLGVEVIAPTIRKKKNKKKTVEQTVEQSVLPESEQVLSLPISTDIINESELKYIKDQTPVLANLEENDVKVSKRKNKKKKRNDSERSGKEEISCTGEFQKLVKIEYDALNLNNEAIIDNNVSLIKNADAGTETANEPEITSVENIKQPELLKHVLEGKSKKKNKKDKKLSPQTEENVTVSVKKPIELYSLPVDTIVIEDLKQDNEAIQKSDFYNLETSLKPKAKIAKPVEKKHKGNQDSKKAMHDVDIAELVLPEQLLPNVSVSTEVNLIEKETSSCIEDKNIKHDREENQMNVSIQQPTSIEQIMDLKHQRVELVNVFDKAMDNNSKNTSKTFDTAEASPEIFESKVKIDVKQSDFEVLDTDVNMLTESNKDDIEKPELSAGGVSKVSITLDSQLELKYSAELTQPSDLQEHVLLTPETLEEKSCINLGISSVDKNENIPKTETKTAKKSKKSPKPSRKAEHKHKIMESADPTIAPTKMALTTSEVNAELEENKVCSNIKTMYDIEICSLKANKVENISCDIVPDITYPHSLSQLLIDDNNNNSSAVVTEISSSPDILLDRQKQKCETSKTVVADKSKETTSPPREEKTDIKSKMMEVNQDMEELRLSIERSLAEFTAMEKTAATSENPCKESKLHQSHTIRNEDDFVSKDLGSLETELQKTTEKKLVEELDDAKENNKQLNTLALTIDKDEQLMKVKTDLTVLQSEPTTHEAERKKVTMGDAISEPKPAKDLTSLTSDILIEKKLLTEGLKTAIVPEAISVEDKPVEAVAMQLKEQNPQPDTPPVCPSRKDNKNKHKKKKGKQDVQITSQPTQNITSSQSTTSTTTQQTKKDEKTDTKTEKKNATQDTKEVGKQQSNTLNLILEQDVPPDTGFEPIDDFEDALTSSVDDINQTFELIIKDIQEQSNPKINIIAPDEEKTPVSPPKNLLCHPNIPVSSNNRDYKKEKHKIPNEITAAVKIKDSVEVERKQSKNTQTTNKLKDLKDCKLSDNEEFVYKYNFRKVFLQSACHVCKKELGNARLACCYCNLVFYCGVRHKDEDWPLHQALCFAVSTIGHLKDQKYIYGDIKNVTGQNYRLMRMQMIVSCEKILKRRLVPWEQEALLYPRVCAQLACREWRQMKLSDCQGCGQISFCTNNQDHYPQSHSRWCKSYSLYQKLVCYQQIKGRLEPRLPTKVMQEYYEIPEKINEVLAALYEEKIDMNDIQYAALTQIATAPLTAAYCHQLCKTKNIITNGYKKSIFTIHVVGAELQFEADALNKWEVFFLHLRPDLQELRVVLINYNLNPSNLPLELLGKIKLCDQCSQDKRRVVLKFQDKRTYADYKSSEDFIIPDLVCAFNPSIQRSSVFNGKDPWPSTINAILKQKIPFAITGYTITELHKDCIRIKECSEVDYKVILEPKLNNFASVRPDRNFITDDEIPLLFKNYCYAVICG